VRKFSASIFFFLFTLIAISTLVAPAFSADEAPPPKGSIEDDNELGLGEKLPDEKAEEKVVTAEDLPPINMVYVKGGCYDMGDWEDEGDDDEVPVHRVCISDFYIQDSEVSQQLFETVLGGLPARRYNKEMPLDPNDPVTYVNWYTANEFIKKLNKITGGFYRLPTEAEWEYAARSGGKQEKWPGLENEAEIKDYAFFEDNSDPKLHNVKQKKPNGLGLYDMAGNVWEWTEDYFDFDYYQVSPKEDPYGADFSLYRSVRGGSFVDPPYKLRTTYRYALEPARRLMHVGFRLAE